MAENEGTSHEEVASVVLSVSLKLKGWKLLMDRTEVENSQGQDQKKVTSVDAEIERKELQSRISSEKAKPDVKIRLFW